MLLEEARRQAGEEEWPRWVEADHRELPFADASFDAAFNLFSSLGYRGVEWPKQYLAVQSSGRHQHPVKYDKLETSSYLFVFALN